MAQFYPALQTVGTWLTTSGAGQALTTAAIGAGVNAALAPKVPKAPTQPGVPTLDEAQKDQQDVERIRQRKGALATITGAASTAGPVTAGKQLLGQ